MCVCILIMALDLEGLWCRDLLEVENGPIKELCFTDEGVAKPNPRTCHQAGGIDGRAKPGIIFHKGEVDT